MTNPTCETCRFFFREFESRHNGDCRRRAPIIHPVLKVYGTYCNSTEEPKVPLVAKDYWCGDHEPKETV